MARPPAPDDSDLPIAPTLTGWRARIIRLGHNRSVAIVAIVSIALSLALTMGIMQLVDATSEYLVMAFCIAIIVPAIVAPIVGHITIGLVLDLDRAHQELARTAARDPLTGVYNRSHFMERMEAEAGRVFRSGDPLTLMMIDADHFKAINDTYGHGTGDRMLVALSRSCEAILRGSDVLARYGGEEFVVLLPATTRSEAVEIAERIRKAIAATTIPGPDGRPVSMTVSIGVSTLSSPDPGCRRLFDSADSALYDAKRSGRNRCVVADRPSN